MVSQQMTFEGSYATIGGFKLHYLDEGNGDPVVMLHGNPTWSIYYRNLVAKLRDRYRCIVPDHIGMGLSDKPSAHDYAYTLEQRVNDLDQLLSQLGIEERVTLVLHDWGGMIGMAWAHRYPDRIKRLVITNTGAFHLPSGKKFPIGLRLSRDTFLGPLLIRGFNAFATTAARIGCKRNPMSQELQEAYCKPYNSWANRIATLKFVQDIPLTPGDPGYDLITEVEQSLSRYRDLPSLIVWGEKDFVFDWRFRNRWEKFLPKAKVHRFNDCGHYILEDAADEVIPLIDQFLTNHPLEA